MKPRYLVSALLLPILAGLLLSCDNEHPPDSRLIANYQSHEADFQKMIRMVKDDSNVVRISPDFTMLGDNYKWPRPESELGFTKERWEEYRQIFRKLELEDGVAWYTIKKGPVLLLASVKSRASNSGGSTKGYAFSTEPLSPVLESLDDVRFDGTTRHPKLPVYRKITDNWYLYYIKD